MSIFPVICGIILIIIAGIFLSKTKLKEVKPEVIVNKENRPVIIELFPKGTSNNPVRCKVNDTIYFKVFGYSDYKKENEVELEGSNIMWHQLYPTDTGKWEKDFGVLNTYSAPSKKGYFDVYVKYRDSKLITSSKVKILVEV